MLSASLCPQAMSLSVPIIRSFISAVAALVKGYGHNHAGGGAAGAGL